MSSLATRTLPLDLRNQIQRLLDHNNKLRAQGKKTASTKTQSNRAANIFFMVAQLWELGYRIKKPESLCEKHVQALADHWDKKGDSASMIRCRMTDLRTFATWMGKRDVVKDILNYLPKERIARCTIASRDKSWTGNGVDPMSIIAIAGKIDERFAAILYLQKTFGFRVKESIEIRPHRALTGPGDWVELFEGTKGGRYRKVPIKNAEQRLAIEEAKRVTGLQRAGRLRWPDCTWQKARRRFYWYMEKLNLTLKGLGVTAHGLRHGYIHGRYEDETGFPPPIKGGALGKIDRATHEMASMTISSEAGHGRPDVAPSYYGSYGHQLRNATVKMSFGGMSLPA